MAQLVTEETGKPTQTTATKNGAGVILYVIFALIAIFALNSMLPVKTARNDFKMKHFQLNDMTEVDLAATDSILAVVDNKLEKFKIKSVSIDPATALVTLSTENLGFFEKQFKCDSRVICMDKIDGEWHASYSEDITPDPALISGLITTAIDKSAQFKMDTKHPTAFINQYDEGRISYADWMLKLEVIIRRNNPGAVNIDMWQEWSNWQEIYHQNNTPYAAYGISLKKATENLMEGQPPQAQ